MTDGSSGGTTADTTTTTTTVVPDVSAADVVTSNTVEMMGP